MITGNLHLYSFIWTSPLSGECLYLVLNENEEGEIRFGENPKIRETLKNDGDGYQVVSMIYGGTPFSPMFMFLAMLDNLGVQV